MVHPCFLYESIWCIAGFIILHTLSKNRKFSGQIILMYCAWYGFGRGFIELLRTDSLMIGNIRVSSLLSFTLCIAATAALIVLSKRAKASNDTEYSELFADPDDEEIQEKIEPEEAEENEND